MICTVGIINRKVFENNTYRSKTRTEHHIHYEFGTSVWFVRATSIVLLFRISKVI